MTCVHHRKMAQAPALELAMLTTGRRGHTASVLSVRRWCRKMARTPAPPSCSGPIIKSSMCLRTSTSCWWAALALVGTAPSFLCYTPTCHPIGKSGIAIVWFRGRHASTTLIGAALTVDSAAPLLLSHRPACLPIRETIGTIVGVCRGRRLCRLATDVVHPAAPILLSLLPREVLADGAIEWIDRPRRGCRPCHRRGGWRSGWRRWWLRREGRRWNRRRRLRQSRSCASPANCRTAKVLLRLGPLSLPSRALQAIKWQSRRWSRKQPAEQRNQQQKAQKTATRDEASEVPPRPHNIEITTTSDILVGGLLNVVAVASPDI